MTDLTIIGVLIALVMSIVAEILYGAAAPVVFAVLLMDAAFFAQTKPVCNIND